jgi:hypothetical protein
MNPFAARYEASDTWETQSWGSYPTVELAKKPMASHIRCPSLVHWTIRISANRVKLLADPSLSFSLPNAARKEGLEEMRL